MERIESRRNGRILHLVELRKADARRRSGHFFIEGRRECLRAKGNGINLLEIYLDESAAADGEFVKIFSGNCRVFMLPSSVFEKISLRENPDGVLALAKIPEMKLPKSLAPNPLVIVAESIEKPGNLGAILRTADAAGCNLLIATDPLMDFWNPNAIRASQGAIFSVPAAICDNGDALKFLRNNGIFIVGTGPSAEKCYWDSMPMGPLAIAIGNEHNGLSAFWMENVDLCLRIPMCGSGSDSLNAATAAALFIYEAKRTGH
ncbi:MAG: RNA methyltransferase [Puniceicoccales bacterium]|jgi:TrmH family RNA methyltransferase|nr:RNA methyltransferase [Puniceicoccales bacterium]